MNNTDIGAITINMATTKQKKLAQVIVQNSAKDKPETAGQMLANVGYSKHLAKQPGRVLESDGVQEELEILGFTEDNAKTVVSEVMLNEKAKDKDRLKASEMVFKVKGTFAPEKSVNVNANINVDATSKEAQELADEYEEKLRAKLLE